ncbi:hypothetical protein YC2023_076600 [Brassica napus]
MDHKGVKGLKERKEHKGLKVHMDHKQLKEHKELKENFVKPAFQISLRTLSSRAFFFLPNSDTQNSDSSIRREHSDEGFEG